MGVKLAVAPLQFTVPAMLLVPLLTKKVAIVMVGGAMTSEKVAEMTVFTPTSVALLAGLVELTVGGVVSGIQVTA